MTIIEENRAITEAEFTKALAVLERSEQEMISVRRGDQSYPGPILSEWRDAKAIIALSPFYKAGRGEMEKTLADARPVVVEQARHTAGVLLAEYKELKSFETSPQVRLKYRGAQVATEVWLKDWTERIDIRDRLYEYRAKLSGHSFVLPEELMAARLDEAVAEGRRNYVVDLTIRYLSDDPAKAETRHQQALHNMQSIISDARKAGFSIDTGRAELISQKIAEGEPLGFSERP